MDEWSGMYKICRMYCCVAHLLRQVVSRPRLFEVSVSHRHEACLDPTLPEAVAKRADQNQTAA